MKQERRNKQLTISLVVFSLVIAFLIWRNVATPQGEIPKNLYNDFDLKSVDRVILESPKGKTELSYQGYRWQVNNSYEADRNLIEVLFATIKQAEPKRPVSSSLSDSISKQLKTQGVKVSLFKGEEELTTFYAGGNEQKTQAYFVGDESDDPNLVVIPGYRVYASGIFELPAFAWREKQIFDFNWQNFSKLEAHYKNSSGDFEVMMQKNQVFISGIEADTAKLNSYLDQISLMTVAEYVPLDQIPDTVSSQTPVVRLMVYDIANREYKLEVFASRTEIFGRINGEIWAILNKNEIVPILRPKQFFVKG